MAKGMNKSVPFQSYSRISTLIADVARTNGTPLPMAGLAAQMFRLLKAARGSQADVLEVYKLSEPSRPV